MKNVMTRAWEIARNAVEKFGGKVKEYFAQALKMAWAEVKKSVKRMNERKIKAMEELVFSINLKNGKFVASLWGDTYVLKEEIKKMGYTWDEFKREWVKKFSSKIELINFSKETIAKFNLKSYNLSISKEAQKALS